MLTQSDKQEMVFTPETLNATAIRIEKLRWELLRDMDEAGADPIAEQHYLLGLSALEQAQRAFKIAYLLQMQALAR